MSERRLMSPHEIEREERNKTRHLFHWMPPGFVIDTGPLPKNHKDREKGAEFWVIEELHAEVQGQIKWDTRDPDYPRYYFSILRRPEEPCYAPTCYGALGSDDLEEVIQCARDNNCVGVRGVV